MSQPDYDAMADAVEREMGADEWKTEFQRVAAVAAKYSRMEREAAERIAALEDRQRWRAWPEERPPWPAPHSGTCLVRLDVEGVASTEFADFYAGDPVEWDASPYVRDPADVALGKVTHWMPLPEDPTP